VKLQVVHRTAYGYATPVKESFNEARLQPVTADGQRCHSFLLKTIPAARLSHYLDFFLNYVHFFEITEPHDKLSVESISEVTTAPVALPCDALTAPLSRLPECASMEQCYDFIQASAYVSLSPEVWHLAVDACQGQTDIWQSAVAIMRFIHSEFAYVPFSTDVNTHMLEVLARRSGVCQDFAHVMLGMLRTLKIPARYVSGYLYNSAGGPLAGAQASHAWCEVFVPDHGWRALDPTNNQPADERYIKLAVGRDYADVAPLKGHYKGTPHRTMQVQVQIHSLAAGG
jgi:transglutaminase-like putative cysteine protease